MVRRCRNNRTQHKNGAPILSDKVMRRTVTSAATDENVSLLCLREYFCAEAWAVLQSIVKKVESDPPCVVLWYCGTVAHAQRTSTMTKTDLWHVTAACSGHILMVFV
ncbi:hypothetical protein LSH36_574g01044 [Paralvinella palmiformis]|uniref:Uncharacterized protein n=1 Tax=Paralvinella palmiformis TaxID=53620 RepID=A0AAD9J6G8_9ANNE|nr:hypothetical protein LSH36_574g01044 [Paralvinella palmiformis]